MEPRSKQTMTCCNEQSRQGNRLGSETSKPRVTFSQYSSMCMYHEDPDYSRNKSYDASDKIQFTKERLSDVRRIKLLMMLSPGSSRQSQLKYLLANKKIATEEYIGIENLLLVKNPSTLGNAQKDYTKSVLQEQERQYATKMDAPIDYTKWLGSFSTSVKCARIRAAMAA